MDKQDTLVPEAKVAKSFVTEEEEEEEGLSSPKEWSQSGRWCWCQRTNRGITKKSTKEQTKKQAEELVMDQVGDNNPKGEHREEVTTVRRIEDDVQNYHFSSTNQNSEFVPAK